MHAELARFARAEEAFALLEVFLEVAQARVRSAVLDPIGLVLPDEMTDDRTVVRGVDDQARWDYVRLAYCSNLATVWSDGRRTTYFEVADQISATYWLPDSLKAEYFDALTTRGWAIPADWLTAVAKRPKPWWKRGG